MRKQCSSQASVIQQHFCLGARLPIYTQCDKERSVNIYISSLLCEGFQSVGKNILHDQ